MWTLGSWILRYAQWETMVNLKRDDFVKVRLGISKVLKVTALGDVKLKTPLRTTWNLQNISVILGLKRKFIYVGKVDEVGLDIKFGGGRWKVIGGNLVIARGKKRGSLHMVEVPSEGCGLVPVKSDKVC
ncbi:hypothetical protein L1987_24524 [Smallanthus sonchifolius]|uniref:Uncharacterized protein n=1 Tax=Smallanthus sonchifolius TaxID=185202 RepID=A0ACB9IM58_9ASTR|nr:hypothetical protein L1987_24524 [Smallanthus sonchifolius]